MKAKPRLNFMKKLSLKLFEMNGECEIDNEEMWVSHRVGHKEIVFSFDSKGEKIEDIGVFEDVLQVVDQKKIF